MLQCNFSPWCCGYDLSQNEEYKRSFPGTSSRWSAGRNENSQRILSIRYARQKSFKRGFSKGSDLRRWYSMRCPGYFFCARHILFCCLFSTGICSVCNCMGGIWSRLCARWKFLMRSKFVSQLIAHITKSSNSVSLWGVENKKRNVSHNLRKSQATTFCHVVPKYRFSSINFVGTRYSCKKHSSPGRPIIG